MIFPSRKLVLLSALKPDEAQRALGAAVAPRRNWRQKAFTRGKGNFMGEVNEGGFSLVRDISYRNSFLPRITGPIGSGSPASRIEVSMRMEPAVMVFMAVWLGFVLLSLITGTLSYFHAPENHRDGTFFMITGGMALFGVLLPQFSFRPEAKKAEKFLKEVLKAEVDLPPDSRRAI
jgi:hypothetical protein